MDTLISLGAAGLGLLVLFPLFFVARSKRHFVSIDPGFLFCFITFSATLSWLAVGFALSSPEIVISSFVSILLLSLALVIVLKSTP